MQFNIKNKSNQSNISLSTRWENKSFEIFQEPSGKSQSYSEVKKSLFRILFCKVCQNAKRFEHLII